MNCVSLFLVRNKLARLLRPSHQALDPNCGWQQRLGLLNRRQFSTSVLEEMEELVYDIKKGYKYEYAYCQNIPEPITKSLYINSTN